MENALSLRTACGVWIAREVQLACSFAARAVGLIGQHALAAEAGLLLSPARAIHTMGMRFPIDVVFLSGRMRVLQVVSDVPPWRICRGPLGTARVLELSAGRVQHCGLLAGMFLEAEYSGQRIELTESASCSRPAEKVPCERSAVRFSLRLPLRSGRAERPVEPCSRASPTKPD